MNAITNLLCKFLFIGIVGIVSAYASGYEEYLKELGELKGISREARAEKPEIQVAIKSEYNELARDVNKYIDYFIQVVDEKTPFNFSDMNMIIKSINQKSDKLINKIKKMEDDRKLEVQAFANPMIVMSGLLLTIQIAKQLYDFCKELKDDYNKYTIKKELTSYKWEKME